MHCGLEFIPAGLELSSEILNSGVVDEKGVRQMTILQYAIVQRNLQFIQHLVENGANIFQTDK